MAASTAPMQARTTAQIRSNQPAKKALLPSALGTTGSRPAAHERGRCRSIRRYSAAWRSARWSRVAGRQDPQDCLGCVPAPPNLSVLNSSVPGCRRCGAALLCEWPGAGLQAAGRYAPAKAPGRSGPDGWSPADAELEPRAPRAGIAERTNTRAAPPPAAGQLCRGDKEARRARAGAGAGAGDRPDYRAPSKRADQSRRGGAAEDEADP